MTVYRLFTERAWPPLTKYVVGRSFVVGIRGADAAILANLERHSGRELVTAEELMACVPFTADGVDDLLVVTVDGLAGDEASPDAGALSDADPGERRITAVARGSLAADIYSVGGSRRFSARGIRPFAIAEFRAVTAFALIDEKDEPLGVGALGANSVALPPGLVDGHGLAWSRGEGAFEETTWRPPISEQTIILPRRSRLPIALDDTIISISRTRMPPEAERTTLREQLPGMILGEAAQNDTKLIHPRDPRPEKQGPMAGEPEVPEDTLRRAQQFFPVFRIGDQSAEALDGILYLGRNPRVPRGVSVAQAQAPTPTPARAPVSVRVLDSPTQAVSGTHASLERSGTTIVVTDLGSRNGTIAHVPGVKPRRLREGESFALPPRSWVEFGDDNVVYVLSPAPAYSLLESGDSS